jgi:hypothetical protein
VVDVEVDLAFDDQPFAAGGFLLPVIGRQLGGIRQAPTVRLINLTGTA